MVNRWIETCLFVRQAAQRYLDLLKRAESGEELFYFSAAHVCDVCDFFEKMPIVSGGRRGERFTLQPPQIWWLASIFGFRRNDPAAPREIGQRLVREVYLEVPRGNGKSPFAAIVSLYVWLCEDEMGSMIFIGAPKEDQARYVFDPMHAMVTLDEEFREHYRLKTTKDTIYRLDDPGAEVRMVSSIAKREDGANPHMVVMEELHAQDEALFNVMTSSLGKRPNNLFLSITTAGNRASGICWNTRNRTKDVLAGRLNQDFFFCVIYTLDEDDVKDEEKRYDPKTWLKCNPMWGHTLTSSALVEMYEKARSQSMAALIEFDRTRLNLWQNAAGALVRPDHWEACRVPGLDIARYKGHQAVIGVDLASKRDFSSVCVMIPDGSKIACFWKHYVPRGSPYWQTETLGPLFEGWARQGKLIVTPTPVTDYGFIEAEIRDLCLLLKVEAIAFDKYQANTTLSNLYNDGLPAMEMPTGIATVSDPAQEFFSRIEHGLIMHDGCPVTEWMAMNVVGYKDKRGNLLPQKEDPDSDKKIDGMSAAVYANVVRLDKMLEIEVKRKSVYETRGLRSL